MFFEWLSMLDSGFILLTRGCFQDLINLESSGPKQLCHFRQRFVVSGKPLSFTTRLSFWSCGNPYPFAYYSVCPNSPAIDNWTTTPDWVMSCQYCTYNNSYCIEIFNIYWKMGIVSLDLWSNCLSVAGTQDPCFTQRLSGCRWRSLRIQFPL